MQHRPTACERPPSGRGDRYQQAICGDCRASELHLSGHRTPTPAIGPGDGQTSPPIFPIADNADFRNRTFNVLSLGFIAAIQTFPDNRRPDIRDVVAVAASVVSRTTGHPRSQDRTMQAMAPQQPPSGMDQDLSVLLIEGWEMCWGAPL